MTINLSRPGKDCSGASVLRVGAGEDHEGEKRGLGVSTLAFKVAGQGSTGLFVVVNVFHARVGPGSYGQEALSALIDGGLIN